MIPVVVGSNPIRHPKSLELPNVEVASSPKSIASDATWPSSRFQQTASRLHSQLCEPSLRTAFLNSQGWVGHTQESGKLAGVQKQNEGAALARPCRVGILFHFYLDGLGLCLGGFRDLETQYAILERGFDPVFVDIVRQRVSRG